MDNNELEKFYNKRLQTILKVHLKMILNDKNLTLQWKQKQMKLIEEMLNLSKR